MPLPSASLESLTEFSHLFREKGHAVVWAIGFETRNGRLPSVRQVVIGVQSDLSISVSRTSAWRALCQIRRERPVKTEPTAAAI